MNILGIDPGATTGWVVYCSDTGRVTARGMYRGHDSVILMASGAVASIACLERVVPHGASYPQVVEAAYTSGRIHEWAHMRLSTMDLKRTEVRRILQDATHGAIKVKDDASVWAALKELHGGEESTKKGGGLHGVRMHERAALAVAVACALQLLHASSEPAKPRAPSPEQQP